MKPSLLLCLLVLFIGGCSSLDLYRAETNEQISGGCGARHSSYVYHIQDKFSLNASVSRHENIERVSIMVLVAEGEVVRLSEPYFSVAFSTGEIKRGNITSVVSEGYSFNVPKIEQSPQEPMEGLGRFSHLDGLYGPNDRWFLISDFENSPHDELEIKIPNFLVDEEIIEIPAAKFRYREITFMSCIQ